VILGLGLTGKGVAQTRYQKEQEAWRLDREEKLKAEDGWLTVTGLFWLREGVNEVGSAPSNDIVLSSVCATPRIGAFDLEGEKVTLRVEEGVPVKIGGQLVRKVSLEMVANSSAPIVLDDLTFLVLKRGAKFGLRVKDRNAPARRDFTGLRWYPAQEEYRVEATLHPYEHAKEVPIVNLLGDIEKYRSPGLLRFTIKGEDYSLEPLLVGENRLFIIFRDLTSNRTTYGAARFLYATAPVDGKVILDFNQAINPPCAFTIYATCPLPPQQNRLKVAIEAGELIYHHAVSHQAINR
jgi:uncharacterized protein (DUF1684 family)